MDIVIEIIKLGIVGLISGIFSSILANRDHRQKKFWELRVSAYQAAIEALSDLVYYYDKHYDMEIEGREISQDFKKKLDDYWEQSFPKIRKYADSGAFLFSETANEALREFMKDDKEKTYLDHLENNYGKAKKCLQKLVSCSKVDLKLKPSLLDRIS